MHYIYLCPALKKSTSVVFMLAFCANMLCNTTVYLNYLVNQETIEQLFCVNKEEPELQCNGTCHLGKQLASNNGDDEQQTPPELRFEVLVTVAPDKVVTTIGEPQYAAHKVFVADISGLPEGYFQFDTPPPKCA